MSHAPRGKSWRGLGLAGIQPQCRAFGATASLAGMLHPNFCGIYWTKFECFLSKIQNVIKLLMSCIRCTEVPLCEAQSFSQRKRTEARIQYGLGFAKQFCGKGSAKPRLIPFRQNLHFAVQEGTGGMHGGFFGGGRQTL